MVNDAKVFTFSQQTSVLHLQLWSLRPLVESLNKPDERLHRQTLNLWSVSFMTSHQRVCKGI